MTRPDPEKDRKQQIINLTIAGIAGQVGCLTLIIVLVAVIGGIWLDARLETRPWFTLGLLVLSVPISLAVMFYVVRAATAKIKPVPPKAKKPALEEASLGDDT
ncbi:AtpZ/AtpI family protein [uncultured Thermanaerothrix sp.]|uniref:AtpZ/AtpI family protein n=1 Tax=uncultured Thermanaerothrix sp. TaxID=1195149 RepID=UPI002604927D|nr:AtpZ/AtpI family protein [uncultured Thermanaerothrix sp.]